MQACIHEMKHILKPIWLKRLVVENNRINNADDETENVTTTDVKGGKGAVSITYQRVFIIFLLKDNC